MTASLAPIPGSPTAAVPPPRLLDPVAQADWQRGAAKPTTAQLGSWLLPEGVRGRCQSARLAE
jgi:hypothetical protein